MIETWLKFALGAFVPLVVALCIPRGLRVYFIVAGLGLLATGVILLIRQERRKRHDVIE